MLKGILYFLPCLICLMWSSILLLKKRNRPQNYLLIVLSIGTAYYATYGIAISPSTDYHQMAYLNASCQYIVPVWMIFHLLYIESHLKRSIINSFACFCLFILPCVHASVMAVIYYIMDIDSIATFLEMHDKMMAQGKDFVPEVSAGIEGNMYRIYHFTAEKQFHALCIGLCSCTFIMGIVVMKRFGYKPFAICRFLFSDGEIASGILPILQIMIVILLQCPLMFFGRSFVASCPTFGLIITILQSISIFCMGYVEYLSDDRKITSKSLKNIALVPDTNVTGVGNDEYDDDPVIDINDDEAEEIVVLNDKIESLMNRIEHAFEVDKVYKIPDLTLPMLAERLNTNRTTLATVLKFKYKMTFKDYLTLCRIEKAKRYMIAHPDEVMEVVAENCGFAGASNFSHKFKDEVGLSPKSWLQNQLNENRTKKNG